MFKNGLLSNFPIVQGLESFNANWKCCQTNIALIIILFMKFKLINHTLCDKL
jgi:hypothetical protein